MKVAVTGASGFLGSHFLEMYKNKFEIIALSRKSIKNQKDVEFRQTDYSKESLRKVLSDCEAILHLGANRPYGLMQNDFMENIRVDKNIFEAALEIGIKNIVFTSSRSVYGNQQAPWKETQKPMPTAPYALAKYQSEITAEYFNQKGMNIKVLRIAQVFGLGEYESSAISTFIRNSHQGIPIVLTVTGILREYIYIKDLMNAFSTALTNENHKGIYNVGSGELIKLEDIAKTIVSVFQREKLVQIAENPKFIEENSIMDSSLFYKTFKWKPSYTFASATKDIWLNLQIVTKDEEKV